MTKYNYYDSVYYLKSQPEFKWYNNRLIDKFNINGVVLDLGCGTGSFLHKCSLRTSTKKVIGVELSENAFDICMQRNYGCNGVFQHMHLKDFNVDDEDIDFITCFGVLEHIENKDHVLNKVSKLSDKNTTILFSVPISEFLLMRLGFKGTDQINNREDIYSIHEWRKLFSKYFVIKKEHVDKQLLDVSWMLSRGPFLFPLKALVGIFISSLPIDMTYQVIFEMKKR